MSSADTIEAFFVGWTFLGFVIEFVNLGHAVSDWRFVKRHQVNAGRTFIVLDEIRSVLLRLVAQGTLVVIALMALGTPNREIDRTPEQWLVLGALLLLPAVLAVNAVLDVLARRRLQRMYRRR